VWREKEEKAGEWRGKKVEMEEGREECGEGREEGGVWRGRRGKMEKCGEGGVRRRKKEKKCGEERRRSKEGVS